MMPLLDIRRRSDFSFSWESRGPICAIPSWYVSWCVGAEGVDNNVRCVGVVTENRHALRKHINFVM